MKEVKLELKLENLYGGDGFERPITRKVDVYGEKEKVEITRDKLGAGIEREQEKKKTREVEESVHTFKTDDDDTKYYKIGGKHGKLWGAMKEAGYLLYEMEEADSKAMTDRTMKAVQIQPKWAPLNIKNGAEVEVEEEAQQLNTRGNSQINLLFDVIPECRAEVVLKYPEQFDERIKRYLEIVETLGFGNRRKGSLTVESIEDM